MVETLSSLPYRSSPIFDEETLPQALRRDHRTKQGVWGVIRVLSGRLKFVITATGETHMLDPETPGLVLPDQLHYVEVVGPVQMQVDFYDSCPRVP
ncbi:MAG TPA: DUF1971 domain-containing protein [Hyphomonadaceae bacterium]|nr:DUF1971 domain-containing protein [Hyphomonadaceae bacterium]